MPAVEIERGRVADIEEHYHKVWLTSDSKRRRCSTGHAHRYINLASLLLHIF
jgi:hypothetical protein